MSPEYRTIRQLLDEVEMNEDNHIAVMEALVGRSQVHLPSTPSPLEVGMKVFRARAHKKSTDRFLEEKDLSYRRDWQNVPIGRANLKQAPIFYGAVSAKEMRHGWHIANAETSAHRPPDVQTFTTSVWEVIKPIELMPLVPLKKQAERMEVAMKMHLDLMAQIKDIPEEKRSRTLELLTVIGQEFSEEVTDPKDYLISAAFAHIIYNKGFAGISYPSVRNDFRAFNVAILPGVVDTHMKLIGAQITQIQKVDCPTHGVEYTTPHFEIMRTENGEPFRYDHLPANLSLQPCTGRQLPWIVHG